MPEAHSLAIGARIPKEGETWPRVKSAGTTLAKERFILAVLSPTVMRKFYVKGEANRSVHRSSNVATCMLFQLDMSNVAAGRKRREDDNKFQSGKGAVEKDVRQSAPESTD